MKATRLASTVLTAIALAVPAQVLAAPAHADPDTDFANELHTYGIYGQKDYNAWIGKITCKRLYNGVDKDAYKSAQFILAAAAEGHHDRAGVAVPRRRTADLLPGETAGTRAGRRPAQHHHRREPPSAAERCNSKEAEMLGKAIAAVTARCRRAGRPSRRVRRRDRRLPDPEPDTQDHLHRRPVHGRGARHRPGVLRALHDRLQQQARPTFSRAPATASTGSSRWTTRDGGSIRRTPRPTSTTSRWQLAGPTGRSCSSTTRASPPTAPTSARATRRATRPSGTGDDSAPKESERGGHPLLECRRPCCTTCRFFSVGSTARPRTRCSLRRRLRAPSEWPTSPAAQVFSLTGSNELHPEAVYGVDMSEGMLAQAKKRSSAVTWLRGPAERLPFDDGALDAVVTTSAFHFFDQPAALREFHRVLAPGGLAAVATFSPRQPVLLHRLYRQPVQPLP